MTGVALIVAGAGVLAVQFIGSIAGVYGTAYGAMVTTKSVLFALLLLLGFANFRSVGRFAIDAESRWRVRRFVEVEIGIGCAVLLAAASITSMPPAVDLVADRVTLPELEQRMAPKLPRLESPDHQSLAIPPCRPSSTGSGARVRSPRARRRSCRARASCRRATRRTSRGPNTTTTGPAYWC